MGMMFVAQIQSIASSLTRTQPCDTGVGGTYESPWTAKPPTKNRGRQSARRPGLHGGDANHLNLDFVGAKDPGHVRQRDL